MPTPAELIDELDTLIPVLKEKELAALIPYKSHEKAASLVRWHKIQGRMLTDKQIKLVERLIYRAKKKHAKGGGSTVVLAETDKIVEAAVARVLDRVGEAKIDVDAVLEAIERRAPRKVEILVKREDTGKIKKVKGPTHVKFADLLRAASIRMPDGSRLGIFLQGEASSGKTTGSRMVAEVLDMDWHYNGAISFAHEMLGFIDGHGKYHSTPFRRAYEQGGVYTFDEVDRSDPVALLAVNPHLAGNVATFPDKQIRRHRDCVIICTANTWGLGADANYSGATKLDAAFLSRFPVRINWDIDPELESAIVTNPTWLARVRRARDRARTFGLKVLIDTRTAQAGASLIESGYSEEEAAQMTFLANLKPEQRKQLEAA